MIGWYGRPGLPPQAVRADALHVGETGFSFRSPVITETVPNAIFLKCPKQSYAKYDRIGRLVLLAFDISDGIAYGSDLFGVFVRDRESAPRSLVKLAVGTASEASTPSLSTMISTTFEEMSDITFLI